MKALITGTSQGIGKATTNLFLNKGIDVIGFDIQPATITHPNYTHYKVDISQSELPSIDDIDYLINNARQQSPNYDLNNDIDINLKGTINITQKYGYSPNIKSVVFLTSASTYTGAEFPSYVSSKGAIVSYMKYTAQRLAKYGTCVNGISAGGVITPLNNHITNNEKLYNEVKKETLLNKWASADEIAQFIYFIVVINKSMTGQDILVDNGEMLKSNFIW